MLVHSRESTGKIRQPVGRCVTLALDVSDAIPSPITDRGSGHVRLAAGLGNSKPVTASYPGIQVGPVTPEEAEDAPVPSPGVLTSALRAGEALGGVAAAVSRSAGRRGGDGQQARSLPMWVVALVALVSGGGGHLGSRSLLGPDPEVLELRARVDSIVGRVDRTEEAIAASDVMRVAEVRFLIDLSVKGFGQLGVSREDLPSIPTELADRYHTIEVEDTRRKLFPTQVPATAPPPSEPSKLPTP